MNTINLYFSEIQIAYGFLQAFRAVYSFGLYRLRSYTLSYLSAHIQLLYLMAGLKLSLKMLSYSWAFVTAYFFSDLWKGEAHTAWWCFHMNHWLLSQRISHTRNILCVSGTADMLFSLGVRYCEMVCDTINSCIEYSASIHYSGLDNKTKHAHFLGNNSKDQRPWERDRDMDYVWMGALSHVNYITKSCFSLVTLSLRYWCSGCWPL